jgi:hypothetical protein
MLPATRLVINSLPDSVGIVFSNSSLASSAVVTFTINAEIRREIVNIVEICIIFRPLYVYLTYFYYYDDFG